MPIVRKLVGAGNSKAISIPKSYVVYWQKKHKKKLKKMTMDITGDIITLEPI